MEFILNFKILTDSRLTVLILRSLLTSGRARIGVPPTPGVLGNTDPVYRELGVP